MTIEKPAERRRIWPLLLFSVWLIGTFISYGAAQVEQPNVPPVSPNVKPPLTEASDGRPSPNYLLSFDDSVVIQVQDVSEITPTALRIDKSGYVRVPLIGRVKAAGLTVEQFEAELKEHLKTYVLNPEVTVLVSTYRSQPVSIIGAVKNPGTYQLEGRKTLVEMIALAGGLDATAGGNVEVTRQLSQGPLPTLNVIEHPEQQVTMAAVRLSAVTGGSDPAGELVLKPFDVVNVPRAKMIYVVGQVNRAGGFPLQEKESLGVLQAIALAGGLDPTASPQHGRVLRTVKASSSRNEVPVNVRDILDGQKPDFQLQPDDILFIPTNAPKKAMIKAVEVAVEMGTGVVIWRH
ncbi:MAG TPA: polysaccharide biosynthesis/export family protein [Bryobacteraceae bacterium]|nr:polysaccharide biosynthesis/export family protein [Bryobacteraceae bacterium]